MPNDKDQPPFFVDPSGSELHFRSLSDDPQEVTIYNMSGIPVTAAIVSAQSCRISIQKLPKGIYDVVIEDEDDGQSILFIK